MKALLLLLATFASAAPKAVEPVPSLKAVAPAAELSSLPVPVRTRWMTGLTRPAAAAIPSAPVVIDAATRRVLAVQAAQTAALIPSTAFDGARRRSEPTPVGADRESGRSGLEPPRPQPRRTYGVPLRLAAASALSLAAVRPALRGEVPASALAYALATAWTLAAAAEILHSLYLLGKRVGRGADTQPETRPRWRRALAALGALSVGTAVGTGVGSAPWKAQGPFVERGLGLAAPELGARDAGTLFAEEALADFAANPASAAALARIKGLKTPRVFVGVRSELPVRYEPRLHALVIAPKALAARHWTPEEFVRSPELHRRLARELRADAARELFRMSQAMHNAFYDGQNLDAGPIEAEREAVLFEHDFVHALLKGDPRAAVDVAALARYEAMLGDFRRGLARHDGLPEVARRGYWNAGRYRALFLHREFNWPEHAFEGYQLLARRATTPSERARWIAAARELAEREGIRTTRRPQAGASRPVP